jgi:hypothetical protein
MDKRSKRGSKAKKRMISQVESGEWRLETERLGELVLGLSKDWEIGESVCRMRATAARYRMKIIKKVISKPTVFCRKSRKR